MESSGKVESSIELHSVDKLFSLYGGWIIIAHTAHLTGDLDPIKRNINLAILNLLKRYPRMRSQLRCDDFRRFLDVFEYDENFLNPRLFYSIDETNTQTWQEVVDDVCNRNPFNNGVKTIFPLFHFKILVEHQKNQHGEQVFHLILFSNHSTSDGRSGLILINDLLTLVTTDQLEQHVESVNTQIVPSVVTFTPRPYGIFYPIMARLAGLLIKHQLRSLRNLRIPVKSQPLPNQSTTYQIPPVKTNFLFTSTSSTLYSRLHEKCKSHQVTLHGPLLACLFLAIDQIFPMQKMSKGYLNPWNVDVDFDLRSRIPNSPLTRQSVGFFVGIGTVKNTKRSSLRSTNFWRLAAKCVSITNKLVENGEVFMSSHMFKRIFQTERRANVLLQNAPDGRVGELNFSNIGKYPYNTNYNQGQIKLRGLHVVNNGSTVRVSAVVLITCAGDGQFDISLAHEIETQEKAQEFLNYYIQLIETCADSDGNITLQELINRASSSSNMELHEQVLETAPNAKVAS